MTHLKIGGREISRSFVAAILLAIGVVVQDPRSSKTWSTAVGIIAAAISGGPRKNGNGNGGGALPPGAEDHR